MTAHPPGPAGRATRMPAQAKVNLALAVTGRRPDGFHTLRSVVLRLGLHDELRVSTADGPTDSLEVVGDPLCPVEGNLVLRAAASLRALAGRSTGADAALPGLAFHLLKRIPTAAGLGGGSSDGAAALDLASAAWGVRLHPARRLEAALRLGADVPFFAAGHAAALVGGIGEGLHALPAPTPPAGVLLVTPDVRLPTARVFEAWDARAAGAADGPPSPSEERVDALARRLEGRIGGPGLAELASDLRDANDLWEPALGLAPELGSLREALEGVLGRPVLMTGSGSTLVALYASVAAAGDAAAGLAREGRRVLRGARVIVTHTGEGAA